jgi:photosystem II stability/assembly factor-like uncharacterized protein
MSAHSGPVTGGQEVTIRGSNLAHVKVVDFGQLRARTLARSTSTRLRVRTPASWAGTVRVRVTTTRGPTASSAADRFTFRNPAPQASLALTPSAGDVVATGSDVTSVTGGQADANGAAANQTPWTVTLAAAATVPAVGQGFLLKPGSSVYPSGLAGTVTAVDSTDSPATITVAAPSASLASVTQTAQVDFSGPISEAMEQSTRGLREVPPRGHAASDLTSTIDFGSISASALKCGSSDGVSVDVSGSLSLKLEDVEANVEVDTGSAWDKPFVDVWVSYQPVIAFNVAADGDAECSLPAAWQNTHQKVFLLGDTGATIAIEPDATFSIGAGGTVTFQQHSYRMLGFISNPDGSIRQLDAQSADPAQASASGQLDVAASGGVQIQVGELDVVGAGMSIDGGIKGTAAEPWPPQVCLSVTPFLQGSVYAYLNAWVTEWQLQAFQVELDLTLWTGCTPSPWHVAWQSKNSSLGAVTCPTTADCFAVGGTSGHGYILQTTDGGQAWTATTITAHTYFYSVACSDASHCVVGGNGSKVAVTSNGGATWSEVGLPYFDSPVAAVGSVACLPGGTCYVTAYMTKYSGELVYGSTNSGQTWTLDTVVGNEPDAMTCLDSSSCIAVGAIPPNGMALIFPAASQATRNGWASSSTGSFPAGWKSLENVACVSLSLCYAAGTDLNGDGEGILATTNFGKTWKAVSDGNLMSWAVSCPDSTTCVAGGSAPDWAQYVEETVDGGHSWTKTTISTFPSADNMFTISLACPSPGHCIAIEIGSGPTAIVVS